MNLQEQRPGHRSQPEFQRRWVQRTHRSHEQYSEHYTDDFYTDRYEQTVPSFNNVPVEPRHRRKAAADEVVRRRKNQRGMTLPDVAVSGLSGNLRDDEITEDDGVETTPASYESYTLSGPGRLMLSDHVYQGDAELQQDQQASKALVLPTQKLTMAQRSISPSLNSDSPDSLPETQHHQHTLNPPMLQQAWRYSRSSRIVANSAHESLRFDHRMDEAQHCETHLQLRHSQSQSLRASQYDALDLSHDSGLERLYSCSEYDLAGDNIHRHRSIGRNNNGSTTQDFRASENYTLHAASTYASNLRHSRRYAGPRPEVLQEANLVSDVEAFDTHPHVTLQQPYSWPDQARVPMQGSRDVVRRLKALQNRRLSQRLNKALDLEDKLTDFDQILARTFDQLQIFEQAHSEYDTPDVSPSPRHFEDTTDRELEFRTDREMLYLPRGQSLRDRSSASQSCADGITHYQSSDDLTRAVSKQVYTRDTQRTESINTDTDDSASCYDTSCDVCAAGTESESETYTEDPPNTQYSNHAMPEVCPSFSSRGDNSVFLTRNVCCASSSMQQNDMFLEDSEEFSTGNPSPLQSPFQPCRASYLRSCGHCEAELESTPYYNPSLPSLASRSTLSLSSAELSPRSLGGFDKALIHANDNDTEEYDIPAACNCCCRDDSDIEFIDEALYEEKALHFVAMAKHAARRRHYMW